jgi:hypothetical protein
MIRLDLVEVSMKALLLSVLALTSTLDAVSSTASDRATSPLIGSWSVDVTRLPIPPAARPKSVTITFGDAGDDKRSVVVSIVDAAGKETKAASTYTLDGKPIPLTGTAEADTGALKAPSPDVLILALSKNGNGASTRIYAVQPNGKEMVETAVYYSKDGLPIMRTNYFSRTR